MSKRSATTNVEVQAIPYDEWDEYIAPMILKSRRMAKQMRRNGNEFYVGILAPKTIRGREGEEIREQDQIQLVSVKAEFDDLLYMRDKMLDHAREFITFAQMNENNDPHLPIILASAIEGRRSIETVSSFNYEYGRLVQKVGNHAASEKIRELLAEDNKQIQNLDNTDENEPFRVRAFNAILAAYRHPVTQHILWGQINNFISKLSG